MLKKGSKPSTTWIREEQIDRGREGDVARWQAVRLYCIPAYLSMQDLCGPTEQEQE
jgi:hypothetical protein